MNQRANRSVDISTGEVEDPQPEIDEAARRQGEATSVSPDRRSEIVRKEATSRWENEGGQ